MKKIYSKNYDFLWTVGGMHYLFTSFVLRSGYAERDFIITSDHNSCTFYVSKLARRRLSAARLKLYDQNFSAYEKAVKKQLKISAAFFADFKKEEWKKLSNFSLAEHFLKTIEYFEKIWSQYFWTEYFCLDKVAEIINEKNKKYDLVRLNRNVGRMAKLKFEQRKILNQTFYSDGPMDEYYKFLAGRLKLRQDITNYHYEEIVKMLKGQAVKIPERTIYAKGKFSGGQDIVGPAARKIINSLEKFDPSARVLRGHIGNKGHYTGRVRHIEFSLETDFLKEIKAMKKGEVLVSGSTGPEMILACRKAGAIITDEGGITSHAALVSRELGIPAVIATKYATRILKNGDLVEVDANNGVVRRLSYKK